jgi:tetratricopeptide (TPR) repeat protein
MTKKSRPSEVKRVEASGGEVLRHREVIEAMLSQVAASRTSRAVDDAQEIIFEAWECDDGEQRVALALKALAVSPHCADAWVLLAEETADTPEEAAAFYAKGVEAGEKALGKAAFKEDVGMFWGLIETRPYMRALQGLALSQWAGGLQDEALAHAGEMLRLNPNDNQGVRYLLFDWLLRLGRDTDVASLMKEYRDDEGTEWLWSVALATFRTTGDGAASRGALARAMSANRHVAAYLAGRKRLPRNLPAFVSMGGADEAASYAEEAVETWKATPGAIAWLVDQLGASSQPRAGKARTRG